MCVPIKAPRFGAVAIRRATIPPRNFPGPLSRCLSTYVPGYATLDVLSGRYGRTLRMGGAMLKEPNYYDILGLRSEADAAAIEAAYRGRSLRFRVGQPRARSAEQAGPTQEQIEQAYAILGDPESRALYDAVYFPTKQPPVRRRRIPPWLAAIIGVWLVAVLAVVLFGLRSRAQADGGAIGRSAGQTATIVAAGGPGGTGSTAPSGGVGSDGSPTIVAALPAVTATSALSDATATSAVVPTATVAVAPTAVPRATSTTAPTATVGPTNTATSPPPTATAPAPTIAAVPPTPVPSTATPEPVPPAIAPTTAPEPTATPSFRATDRIGTALSVNLRNGPGAGYASLGLLPTGTLLQATGEMTRVSGQLWRRFVLQDGRVGWVRDLDIFPVR